MKHRATNSVVDSMIKLINGLIVSIIVIFMVSTPKADPGGNWIGAFNRLGAVQEIELYLEKKDHGWEGTYSIPEMILYREPLKEVSVSGDTIHFRLFWGSFTTLYHENISEITGINAKWNPPVSIHLKKDNRHPRFTLEKITFKSDSLSLSGDLLLPQGNAPFPTVVIIEGSTTTGRKNWLYRSYADLFARNGIAAFIYDKRGCGESTGDFKSASLDDLTNDALNAVTHISKHMKVNRNQIGVMGISQGGWIAPRVAVKSDLVSHIILLSGPAVSVWDQEIDQVEYSMRAGINGENDPDIFTEDEIQEAITHTKLGFEVVADISRWQEWQESVQKAKNSRFHAYVSLDSTKEDLLGWLNYKFDPKETLMRMEKPILALFGKNDVLVPPKENIPQLKSYIQNRTILQIIQFDEGGHDLMTGASLVNLEWDWPNGFWRWNRRVPGLADTLINWVYSQ